MMGKKGYKSTWRDPSLYGGLPPHRTNEGHEQSFSSQSHSSESTVAAGRRDFGGSRRSRIQDKEALRGTNNLNYPSSKPNERHAPWDEVSEDEEAEQEQEDAPDGSPERGQRFSVLSRSNLRAHEDESLEPKGPVEYQPAVSVSDLIELESHHYDDDLNDDMAAQKNAEDELFDSNDVEASVQSNYDAEEHTGEHDDDQDNKSYRSDTDDIPHTEKTSQQYAQPFFAHSIAGEENRSESPEQTKSEVISNGRTSSLASHRSPSKVEPHQDVLRSRLTDRGAFRSPATHLRPDSAAYVHYSQSPSRTFSGSTPVWSSSAQADMPAAATVTYQQNQISQRRATIPVVQTLEGQFKQIEPEEMDWACENEVVAKRPPLGRPNTKALVFAVSTSRDNRTNELDMFCVHSHLIRLFWPLMAITAHRNEYVRSDGSFLVDSDSIVSKEFSYFVQWLYTGHLVNEDNDPLTGGSLIRLYKFALREDLPFLRDDLMTALFRYSFKHPDWKPTPVLFDTLPSDSMICKFVAVTWANCAKELQGVDINKMIQASTKGPAPIIEFMRMAWAEANNGSGPQAVRRTPCDFHEHSEVRQEEDERNHVLWDWV